MKNPYFWYGVSALMFFLSTFTSSCGTEEANIKCEHIHQVNLTADSLCSHRGGVRYLELKQGKRHKGKYVVMCEDYYTYDLRVADKGFTKPEED